jgi:predicted AAA+ superfamily ATPase
MQEIQRSLNIELPEKQSAFLWGARKTGKTTLLRNLFPDSLYYDFLETDLFYEMTKQPSLLRQQLLSQPIKKLSQPVILDEIQKVPALLDEVHWLIENKKLKFILCGSSARKLKRGHANLLGGRAWRYELLPLTSAELPDLDILRVVNNGLIPSHYLQEDAQRSIKAYVLDYLKEEVFNEGLTRNIPAFSRFFDALGFSHGDLTNYSNIARDCGVDAKTVREYYHILVDTMLGSFVEPYHRRQDRSVISQMPKFYLFDVGVASYITKRKIVDTSGDGFGRAFEHFIYMELYAYRAYSNKEFSINFWRTKTGQEVDFILDGEIAIEVKSGRIDQKQLRHLKFFNQEYKPRAAFIVSNEKNKRVIGDITIIPWAEFLALLWSGKII